MVTTNPILINADFRWDKGFGLKIYGTSKQSLFLKCVQIFLFILN